MNILFFLEPLVFEKNLYLYTAWLPIWSRLINTINSGSNGNHSIVLITSEHIAQYIKTFPGFPDRVKVLPVEQEQIIAPFDYSPSAASLAWYRGDYSADQINDVSKVYASLLGEWKPEIVISSSHVPFLKVLYPTSVYFYFEGGMTSRPPFPVSYYMDPAGLYQSSYLNQNQSKINPMQIGSMEKDLVEDFCEFYTTLIHSRGLFIDFIQKSLPQFKYTILLPLQPEGFWFQGNCDFSSNF